MLNLDHREQLRRRGFDDRLIDRFAGVADGDFLVRSLSAEEIQREWLDLFPSMRGSSSSALLLRFNKTTFSLKPDNLVIDGDRKKYLYSIGDEPGDNTQPWVPSGKVGIATEGLFDALAATYLMDTPCCGATAPSHLGRSNFPSSVKVYVSDADVPFHHSEGFLAMVVRLCRERGLKLAHLPRNPGADYAFTDKIPEECKWGMEEWARVWGPDIAKSKLEHVIKNAKDPVPYLHDVFHEYKEVGLKYPNNAITIANGARAIAEATTRLHERDALRDLLCKNTKAPKEWLNGVIQLRLASIQRRHKAPVDSALGRQQVELPLIKKANPSKADLQEFLSSMHLIRFNELTQMVELDGEPMNDDIEHADQFLAQIYGVEVSKQSAKDCFEYLARCKAYNPIKEYFESLRERTDLRLVPMNEIAKVFGIEENDRLSKELLGRHLVGHVVRGMDPECGKHQQMLILFGHQGTGKSSTLAAMAGPGWYDSATLVKKGGLEDWNFLPKVNGALVFEFDECEKIIRSTTAAEFKGFVTRSSDKYTEKHKSFTRNHPRRSCLWGTTNDTQVLNDPTGSRRFWVVVTKDRSLDPAWFCGNRDSFWATVMTWMKWGLENWLDPQSVTAKAAAVRAQQLTVSDPLELSLRVALESRPDYCKHGISQALLLRRHLEIEPKDAGREIQMRITRIITSPAFVTHDGMVRWESGKRRFPDVNGKGHLVPGSPLHGYLPVPADPTVPSDEQEVVTPEMPWEDRELIQLFQPFKE